jgi:hypothetical protein
MKLNRGPDIFRHRLGKLNNISKLLNPDVTEIKKIKDKKINIIARLDGVNYLYGSKDNISNYLKSRNYYFFARLLTKLPNIFF